MRRDIPKRKTVGSRIYALHTYPKLGSPKEGSSRDINIVITDDEALNLARHLIQASRESKEITIRCIRTPSKKAGNHPISVTYETQEAKKRI